MISLQHAAPGAPSDHAHQEEADHVHHAVADSHASSHTHAGQDEGGQHEAEFLFLSEAAQKNVGLELMTVRLQPFNRAITVPATVTEQAGRTQIEVSAPMTGTVTRIYPLQGETVTPGQPLFDLRLTHEDLVEAQNQLLRTAEELDVIQREVRRLEKVTGSGAIAGFDPETTRSRAEILDAVKRLTVELPDGGATMLDSVAQIYLAGGPNMIKREQARRRIVLQCNTSGRGLVDVVRDIKMRLAPIERSLPHEYFIEYGGQFESQQSAARVIGVLFATSLVGMFLVLYTMFRSANLSLQVMIALPAAFVGAVAALWLTGQTLTVASMVGFISLCGIASRNGILLINHYLHLVTYEGEKWSRAMVVRAGKERVAPVLMTALTSGIGLVPLVMAAGQPGKEILYPVATVIIGGLVTSTLAEFFVRPALFCRFGLRAGRRVLEETQHETPMVELGDGKYHADLVHDDQPDTVSI